MNLRSVCSDEPIDYFLAGSLSEDEVVSFESHLGKCQHCEARLRDRTASGDFWADTRRFLLDQDSTGVTLDSPNQASTILSLLDPTDDPHSLGRLAGYEVTGVVGWGGMGIVLKAREVSLDRFVAIKVLNPSYSGQSAPRKRFSREAQAAAAVVHDHVIAIHGVDHWKDLPFLVMPYVSGESLQQRIDRDAPMEVEDILRIGMQVARGLAAAHDQGLIHRDVKPANILMPAGVSRIILTDFGLARAADDASLTRSGVLAGTPQYMSPEQVRGETLDQRSDLFSLGSVMYAMACGRPPFRSETAYGVLRKVSDQSHHSLMELRNDLPIWLSEVIDRLLQKDRNHRFESAEELAEHLEDCLAHRQQPSTKVLPRLADRPSIESSNSIRESKKRNWLPWAIVLAGCVGVISIWWSKSQTTETLPPSLEIDWSYDDSDLVDLENDLDELVDELDTLKL